MALLAIKSIGSFGRSYVPRWVSIAYAQPIANDFVLVANVYRETQDFA
ncbi:hypothetical protein ACFSC3_17895 [Sphingomonas floccifaciens]|uniref:Uncharacterized protein n=2 Tax=Sphingomonas TaxID=13687 RepID=A0A916TAN9_9SPHN|nr:hypothetical protein [Sphingomonas metalli]GGB37901.1 hypothetical protein GCM10011380_29140 [Sphingomonas metalli]